VLGSLQQQVLDISATFLRGFMPSIFEGLAYNAVKEGGCRQRLRLRQVARDAVGLSSLRTITQGRSSLQAMLGTIKAPLSSIEANLSM
jgi:hypothetical protein